MFSSLVWTKFFFFFGGGISEDKLYLIVWLCQISWGSIVVGFWRAWAQLLIVNVIMLTNKKLDKHLSCCQAEFGISSPPDGGAREYPHGAPGAADSGHTLFCEHCSSLLRWRGKSQPWPGPNAWGRNPFSTPSLVTRLAGLLRVSEKWEVGAEWEVVSTVSTFAQTRVAWVCGSAWASSRSNSRLKLWAHDCCLCWGNFILPFSHLGPKLKRSFSLLLPCSGSSHQVGTWEMWGLGFYVSLNRRWFIVVEIIPFSPSLYIQFQT